MYSERRNWFIVFSSITGSLLLLFLLGPIFTSLVNSAQGIPNALGDTRIINALSLSFSSAFIATILCLITGVPLAYVLSRVNFRGKEIIDSLIDLPILIPHNAAGIALLFLFSPRSNVGKVFNIFGLRFVDSIAGVIIAMCFVGAPYMVRSVQDAFLGVATELEDAASNLGASPLKVFLDISLPLAGRGIISGCMLTWARAVSEFGAVMVLSYYPKTAPVLLFDILIGEGLATAMPMTGLLLITGLIVLIGFRAGSRIIKS